MGTSGAPSLSSEAPRAEIEAALERVLAWPGLARSPQLAKFLSYIVLAKLDGNEGAIKAYSIAVDVLGRPPSFDPQTDPIVRVQARRLRAALEEFYAGEGAEESIRFHLPVGRYIPEIGSPGISAEAQSDSPDPVETPQTARVARSGRSIWAQLDDIVLLVLLVGLALGVALAMTQVLAPQPVRISVPQPPRVSVAEFTSIASGASEAVSVAGLAIELVTDLSQFPFVEAVYLPRLELGTSSDARVPLELSGIARAERDAVQVTASLKRPEADSSIWSMTQSVPGGDLSDLVDDLSRGFADQLGPIGSPLHAETVEWVAEHPDIAGNETEYLCSVLFRLYRQSGDPDMRARSRACTSAVIEANPLSAHSLAIRGALLLEETLQRSPLRRDPEPMAEVERLLQEALQLLPTSSPVWREYGTYLAVTGRVGEAESAFSSALQLNPADLDSVASYGLLLSLFGESERGALLADDAIARSLSAPYWYHQATAINALRKGADSVALAESAALAVGDAELGSVVAAVAARRLGDEDALNRSIAQMLEVTRFRRFGILPILRLRLPDPTLRAVIRDGLADAGIDQLKLNGPF
jgi:hypothetical protein